MAGFGERFRSAGYSIPKPLVQVQGKSIISHVVDMFPGEENLIFVCNEDHLSNPEYQMRELLREAHPRSKVVGISPHKKGPIHTVQQIDHLLEPDQPVVVNYADFTCFWDWEAFRAFTMLKQCAGAIPAFKGFHPHSLGDTNYAYLLEENGEVRDIQEKKPFTANRMDEYASSGTYYFRSAELMNLAFAETVKKNRNVNGEFYVSLAYKFLLESEEIVSVYPLQHVALWGTPEDVEEYNLWSSAFEALAISKNPPIMREGSVVIPMAGSGKRFRDEGFETPKPMIQVSGRPMFIQATKDLPVARNYVFVTLEEIARREKVHEALQSHYPGGIICVLNSLTEGQALTAQEGIDALAKSPTKDAGLIIIAASDSGAIYDFDELDHLLNDSTVDIVVWGFRGYPNAKRNPGMYGWISEQAGRIDSISVKEALNDPARDPIVVGTFIFKSAEHFRLCLAKLIGRDGRTNGEFYIDAMINEAVRLGLRCQLFEISHFLNWGTPNDFRTFEYWQSFFSKWPAHPYSLETDSRIPAAEVPYISQRFSAQSFIEDQIE